MSPTAAGEPVSSFTCQATTITVACAPIWATKWPRNRIRKRGETRRGDRSSVTRRFLAPVTQGTVSVPHSRPGLELEQRSLGIEAAGEARQRAVGADDPVARKDHAHRVLSVGGADRPRLVRVAASTACSAVADRRAVREVARGARPSPGTACRGGPAAARTSVAAGEVLVELVGGQPHDRMVWIVCRPRSGPGAPAHREPPAHSTAGDRRPTRGASAGRRSWGWWP